MLAALNKGEVQLTKLTKKRGDMYFAMALTLPAIALALLFIFIPIVDSIIKSFQDYKVRNIIANIPGEWNNFDNYRRIFISGALPNAIANTFSFVFVVIILQFLLGMALALVLNSNVRCARFFRSIMMTPWVVPTVISALIWMWIFQPQYGLFKYFISVFSFGRVNDFAMLNNPDTALMGIALAALWKQVPLMTLLLLAGLQNVPSDIMEAATIDGAGAVRRFYSVTLPYMAPVIKVSISMSIIENFKQFPLFWTMTGGGPDGATTNLAILSYREAFVSMNMGSGAAVTTIWMLLMVVTIGIYNRLFRAQDLS